MKAKYRNKITRQREQKSHLILETISNAIQTHLIRQKQMTQKEFLSLSINHIHTNITSSVSALTKI